MHDLYICQFGEQECLAGHSFAPAIREHYLIHFIKSGHGALYTSGWAYSVHPGQGFLTLPGDEIFFQASDTAPCRYAWVGFSGQQADMLLSTVGLDGLHRVFACSDPDGAWNALAMLRSDAHTQRLAQLATTGCLLRFLSYVSREAESSPSPAKRYCEKALWYMEGCFDRNVSIQETADFVGLSRSHLYRVMMEVHGCSPKAMLLRIRMKHARQMMARTDLPLEEIARRAGLRSGEQLQKENIPS